MHLNSTATCRLGMCRGLLIWEEVSRCGEGSGGCVLVSCGCFVTVRFVVALLRSL